MLVTDAAIDIAPTLEDKVDIVQNAIDLGAFATPSSAASTWSSVIEASPQLSEWDHDMLVVGRAFLEALVPRLHVRHVRAINVQFEIPV